MGHRRAMLTPFGRMLLVVRVREMGWSVPRAAESAGVSRMTVYKWLRRYDESGPEGLQDRSSRPRISPRQTSRELAERVMQLRRQKRWGPHRIGPALGMPRSTVYQILRRQGESRLKVYDRSTGIPIRYVKERPGQLVHLDVKKLGRIPDGGGHALLGAAARVSKGAGWEYLHVAVDDCSRVAFAEVRASADGPDSARFLIEVGRYFRDLGVHIESVMTDNARAYVDSRTFQAAMAEIGAKHKLTARRRPQTNGKAEAFIKTSLREWAYAEFYPTNQDRLDALPLWLDLYNNHRTHTQINDRTPMAVLVSNLHGNNS